jgi:HPt (histidine-containing phosphotransfer) domain-containing protein
MNDESFINVDWMVEARRIYVASAAGKLSDLERAIDALELNPKSGTNERRLRRLLHNMIGSGGSYGFPEVSDLARAMSDRLHQQIDACLPADEATIAELRGYLGELRKVFEGAGG